MDVLTGSEMLVETDPLTGWRLYKRFARESDGHGIKLSGKDNVSLAHQIMDSDSQEEEVKMVFPMSILDPKNALELQQINQHLARPVTRKVRGGGQPVVRRMLRHNAIEAWETMQKTGGWKRCQPKW